MRQSIWPVVVGIIGLALGCGPDTSNQSGEETEPEPTTPVMAATWTGSCYPGDNPEDFNLVASIDTTNTGDIGIEADVWVTFSQVDADPLDYAEIVKVPVGETVTVEFDEIITSEEWERFEQAGWECHVGGEISQVLDDIQDE